jgi:Flp pilus assembly protein TadD
MRATEEPAEVDPVLDALQRSAALLDVGRPDEAEALVRRALADEPDEPFLRTELARVLIVQERPDDAREQADRAVAAAPGLAYAHAIRALALSGDERRRFEAVDAAREAVTLDPEDPYGHLTLARTALRARRLDEARTAAETAIRLDPEDGDTHRVLGAVLLAAERPVAAEEAFREALRRDPHDATALNDLGVAVQAQGRERSAEARALFEEAARARPADPLPRDNLAADARAWVNGRWTWAIVVYLVLRTVMELAQGDPDSAVIPGGLAAALCVFLVVRARRRRAELSPSAQRLLGEQRWWERTQISHWRPWFWFVPAPVWLVVASAVALGATYALVGTDEPVVGTAAILAFSLAVVAGTGRRTWQRHGASRWAHRGRRDA